MVKKFLNFNTKCRCCLAEDQEMHSLFIEFDRGLKLSDIFRSTIYLEIEEDDGLSPYLCENCTRVMVDFFNFKAVYIENENYIKSFLKERNINDKGYKKLKDFETENANQSNNCNSEKEKLENTRVEPIQTEFDGGNIKINEFVKSKEFKNQGASVNYCVDENVENCKSVKFFCSECRDCFLLKSGFQHHMLQKHDISVSDFGKYISDTTIDVNKLEIEYENIILQCDTCNEKFNTCAEIEEHYKSHKKYVCEQCGAGFLKKSYLNDHAEIHSTEKRHICPICGKAFRRRTVLVKHKRIHTHPRQCVCEICGLRFTDKGTLKTHIKLKHTKERNYNCTICGLWFPLKSTLMKHIYRHNEDRKREYVCELCHMSYKDKSSLNRHYVVKHTENASKHSCSFCEKQYTTKTNLLKHIRIHHKSLDSKRVKQ